MKLTKSQLKKLIESYIYEQDDAMFDDEAAEDGSDEGGDDAMFDEDPAEETGETEGEEDEEPEEEPEPEPEPSELLPDKFPQFKLDVEGEGEFDILFFKDGNDLQYKVNGSQLSNKTTQDFVTLAGYGAQGSNKELNSLLSKILKLDTSLASLTPGEAIKTFKQRIQTKRRGATKDDVVRALGLR